MFLLFLIFLFIGPRFTTIMWWLINPERLALAFPNSILVPILGIAFLPWTTLMYVGIFPGGITGFDWLWLGLALLADVTSYASGARHKQSQAQPTPPPPPTTSETTKTG